MGESDTLISNCDCDSVTPKHIFFLSLLFVIQEILFTFAGKYSQ